LEIGPAIITDFTVAGEALQSGIPSDFLYPNRQLHTCKKYFVLRHKGQRWHALHGNPYILKIGFFGVIIHSIFTQ
jgi:hypothetical protein